MAKPSIMRIFQKKLGIVLTLVLSIIFLNLDAQKSGKTIFENRCQACHKVSNEKLVGPGLAHVNKRRDQDWLIKFIRNSQAVIESGDETAKKLFNEFNQTLMPANKDLSDQEIKNVLNYIKAESKDVSQPSADKAKSSDKEGKEAKKETYPKFSPLPEAQEPEKNYAYNPDSFSFRSTFWMVVGMVVLGVLAFTWIVTYFSR